MTFPAIASIRANGSPVSGSNFTFGAMPAGTVAGDLLVAFGHTTEDNADYADPSGWTRIDSEPGNTGRSFVWARVATGTDPLVFPLSALGNSIGIIVARITGWTGTTTASVEANLLADFSGAGDPPSVTATWGSADNTFIAVCGREGADVTTLPTGYTGGVSGYSAGNWGAVAMAFKESASATDNPGTGFNTGGGTVHVGTIVVRGSVAADTIAPTITGPSGATGATSAINLPENTTAVHTFTANEAVTWDLNGGADVARFTINAGGALSFLAAPDFEAPNDVGTNNTYVVGVRATDGSGNATTQTLTVTVVNANEGPVITSNGGGATAAISVPENTTAVTTLTATDPDAGATLTWTIVGGADAARFQITGAALNFLAAPNFEVPTDVGANNVYDVTVQVSDGTLTDTQAIAVTVTDVGEAGPTFSALTDNIGESGISLAGGTTVYWTWFPSGRPGAMVSPVQGSGTVNSAGRATISHSVAGDGLVVIGRRPGPAVVNDRLFMQFLTLA